MRKIVMALALLMLSPAAHAAGITVFAPGLVGVGLHTLAGSWGARTGNSVAIVGGSVGKVEAAMQAGTRGDLVILPLDDMTKMAALFRPATTRKIGRIAFGLAVKSGAPHPDIATLAKFHAALNGKTVGYNDPAGGSLAGVMVAKVFKSPSFDGVKGVAVKGNAALALPRGDVEMAVGVLPEQLPVKGVDVVGTVPASLGLYMDFSGAVTANAAAPDAAASFLAYLTGPQAAADWKAGGVIAPIP